MTRTLTTATENASQAAAIYPVYLVKLEFDDGDVCLHTGLGDLAFGGDTYVAAGAIGQISQVEENTELARSTLTMTLRGLPTDIVAIVLGEHYQGRPATVYLGYLDPSAMTLIADPVVVYKGRMDTASVEQGDNCAVELSVESRFAAWDRPNVRRYNNADQQLFFPGDRGLEFVEQATEKQIVWGAKSA